MKILDYLAAAIPVVTTSKGAEGLNLVDGDQLLIRDDFKEFSDTLFDLLHDTERARAIGAAGRAYVEGFDWLGIARRYIDVYGLGGYCSKGQGPDEPAGTREEAPGHR